MEKIELRRYKEKLFRNRIEINTHFMDYKAPIKKEEEACPEMIAFEERMTKWLHESKAELMTVTDEKRANEIMWKVLDKLMVSEILY